MFQDLFFYHFLSVWRRSSLIIHLRQVCWWQILFVFLQPENVLISPLILKGIFTGYWILDWQFFSSRTWKYFAVFLWSPGFSWEKHCCPNHFSSVGWVLSSSGCFQDLEDFFVFRFKKLIDDVSWYEFWGVHPLWSFLFLKSVGLCLFPRLGSF